MVQAMAAHNNLTDCLTMEDNYEDLEKIASDFVSVYFSNH